MENAEMLSAPLHNSVSGLEKGVSSLGWNWILQIPVLRLPNPNPLGLQLGSLCWLQRTSSCDAMCELFAAAD